FFSDGKGKKRETGQRATISRETDRDRFGDFDDSQGRHLAQCASGTSVDHLEIGIANKKRDLEFLRPPTSVGRKDVTFPTQDQTSTPWQCEWNATTTVVESHPMKFSPRFAHFEEMEETVPEEPHAPARRRGNPVTAEHDLMRSPEGFI